MPSLEEKVKKIEKEVAELKLNVSSYGAKKKRVSMKNLLKGVKIDEEDVEDARKSLFRDVK